MIRYAITLRNRGVQLFVLVVLATVFVGCSMKSRVAELDTPLAGVTLSGKPIAWGDLPGRSVLINFFSSWCKSCLGEIEALSALQDRFDSPAFTVVGVAIDDDRVSLTHALDSKQPRYPIVLDCNNSFKRFFNVRNIPQTVLVNRKGEPLQLRDPENGSLVKSISGPRAWAGPAMVDFITSTLTDR